MAELKKVSTSAYAAYGRDRRYSFDRVWREVTIEIRCGDSLTKWRTGTCLFYGEAWDVTAHRLAVPVSRMVRLLQQ
jgi:hypothetical protein